MVGWGSRGIGSVGQKPRYYVEVDKAAATNRIDDVMDVVRPVPKAGDAGNWLGVTLRRENEGWVCVFTPTSYRFPGALCLRPN